jgi:hypothetical protein
MIHRQPARQMRLHLSPPAGVSAPRRHFSRRPAMSPGGFFRVHEEIG